MNRRAVIQRSDLAEGSDGGVGTVAFNDKAYNPGDLAGNRYESAVFYGFWIKKHNKP